MKVQKENRGLTTKGMSTPNFALIIISFLMFLCSAYLTKHYYEINFPKDVSATQGLCNISSFWSCDLTTQSPLGSIFSIPTAAFGMIVGLLLFISTFMSSERFEKTNSFIVSLNLLGCIILFFYSIIALKGLCPVCTGYYILSAVAFFLFYKYGHFKPLEIAPTFLGAYAVTAIAIGAFYHFDIEGKKESLKNAKSSISQNILTQFFNLPNLGNPEPASDYRVHSSYEKFDDAPLQLTFFSDFECPFCAKLNEQAEKMKTRYEGKINIQYFFYPLDNNCNPEMKRAMHLFACKAAYLAACVPKSDLFLFTMQSTPINNLSATSG